MITDTVPAGGYGEVEDIRSRVLRACIYLLDSGLISGTWGMACARAGIGDRFVVTPSGMDYRALSAADLPVVGLDGETISGTRKPSSETPMLARLLGLRLDVAAVAHTHSTVATGFAAAGQPIPAILAELAEAVGGSVPCAQYARFGTVQAADEIAAAATTAQAVLLRNHGVVAFGRTVEEAAATALVVEEGARVALVSRLLGGGQELGGGEISALRHIHLTSYGQPGPEPED